MNENINVQTFYTIKVQAHIASTNLLSKLILKWVATTWVKNVQEDKRQKHAVYYSHCMEFDMVIAWTVHVFHYLTIGLR